MDKIEVTQADREAAADAVKAYRDNKNGDWQARIRNGECDDGYMVQAFARHRLATRTDATPVAWMPIESAPTDFTVFMVAWPHSQMDGGWFFDFWAGKHLLDVRKAYDEGLDKLSPHMWQMPTHWQPLPAAPDATHPPATDVAALVEAAKKIMPIRVNDGPDYAEVYFADGTTHITHAMTMNPQDWLDLSAALAPFTKGQP